MKKSNEKEFILCAAIWINDHVKHEQQPINISEGFVICGRRHNNCYQTIKCLIGNYNDYIKKFNFSDKDYKEQQGFITSLDRYVSREEAWEIAIENNQVVYGLTTSDDGDNEKILISENLY